MKLLTLPFRRDSELAVLWAHVNDLPPRIGEFRPDLPEALDAAVGRALAKAPGDRHPLVAPWSPPPRRP